MFELISKVALEILLDINDHITSLDSEKILMIFYNFFI